MISSNAKESSAVIELFARLLNTVLSEFSGSFPIATGRNLKSKCQNRVLTYIAPPLICYQAFLFYSFTTLTCLVRTGQHVTGHESVKDNFQIDERNREELANFTCDRWIATEFYLITVDCLPFHGTRFRGLLL